MLTNEFTETFITKFLTSIVMSKNNEKLNISVIGIPETLELTKR